MNKKTSIIITGFTLVALALWQTPAHLQEEYPEATTCKQAYLNEMNFMRTAWEGNLQSITGQEEPASEMVDQAFESTRTFRCWLEYLCRTVQVSGTADPQNPPTNLLTDHLGRVPGCPKPENIRIPGANLHVIEKCKVSAGSTRALQDIQSDFNECQAYVELNFGVAKSGTSSVEMLSELRNKSNVYITLESVLKRVNARQRARAIEAKLIDILNRMHAMEGQAQYLKQFLNKLYALLPCTISQCD